MSYLCVTKVVFLCCSHNLIAMKKLNYNYPEHDSDHSSVLREPVAVYAKTIKQVPSTLSMDEFLALDKLLPLSQAEWSDALHISDRTLQRYIKDNKPFDGLHAEHLMQIKLLAQKGAVLFASPAKFKEWLLRSKDVLGNRLDFSALQSFWGVRQLLKELGRIEHGVYI